MYPSAHSPGASTAPPRGAAPSPLHYVPIPRRLAEDLRDSSVAVGVYALLARLYRITGAPVPLSPADLQALDPALSYGAATRALRRLADSTYVVVTRARGRKSAYAPTWGAVKGAPLPWDLAAPCLGRPRHIPTVRLDQRLLDTCLGRLRPHPEHPAVIERYVSSPFVTLAAVGGYALALAGLPSESEGLRRLGLLDDHGSPLPLPDDATILAVASQHALMGGVSLTAAGWARTPFAGPVGEPPALRGEALFFVPKGQIGEGIAPMIASPITQSTSPDLPNSAPRSATTIPPQCEGGSHGVMESREDDRSTTIPPPAGGGVPTSQQEAPQEPSETTPHTLAGNAEEPEGCRLLREIGVRRTVRERLAAHPGEQVAHVIAQARARDDVRNLAGWVVSALRELPATPTPPTAQDERPPSVAIIHRYPGLTDQQRDRWIRKFHAATTPAEKRAVLARLEQEHPR